MIKKFLAAVLAAIGVGVLIIGPTQQSTQGVATVDSVIVGIRYTENSAVFPPTIWLMPADTLLLKDLRVVGTRAVPRIPPAAVAVHGVYRDSTVYVKVPRWGWTQAFGVTFRLTNYVMGDSVLAELPQLTAGRVGGSGQVPLVWMGDLSFAADSSVVAVVRWEPFNWKMPCALVGGCS